MFIQNQSLISSIQVIVQYLAETAEEYAESKVFVFRPQNWLLRSLNPQNSSSGKITRKAETVSLFQCSEKVHSQDKWIDWNENADGAKNEKGYNNKGLYNILVLSSAGSISAENPF